MKISNALKDFTDEHGRSMMIGLGLIVIAVVGRLIPHPANFAPIAAIGLLGGAILPRKLAVVLPLAAMMISDFMLGTHSLIAYTWGSFALVALLSSYLLRKQSTGRIVGGSLASSAIFFLISNFGVFVEGKLYAHTWAGFAQCYTNALPFFRGTLMGDLFYATLLFGAYSLATNTKKLPQSATN